VRRCKHWNKLLLLDIFLGRALEQDMLHIFNSPLSTHPTRAVFPRYAPWSQTFPRRSPGAPLRTLLPSLRPVAILNVFNSTNH
jgi:hypothetical protein